MRDKKSHTDKHHKRPRSRGGTNEKENISVVKMTHHRAWHLLFRNFSPDKIASIINSIWLDPDVEFIVVKRKTK